MPKLKDFITAENELDGSEYAYISQLDKTRKTTYQKIKEWLLGTTTLTTTDKTITGAIQELKGKVDINTASFSDKANDTDNSRTTTSKTVTGAINELNSNKLNISDLYKESFKDGMVSFAACVTSGSGNYRVFQPTDFPSNLGYTSSSDFFANVKFLTSDYWTVTAYDLRSDKIIQQKKINGVVQSWKELATTARTVVTATPATGMTILRQNIYIENKTLYGDALVGKTDGTLFSNTTYQLFSIPSNGLNYNRTVATSNWSDVNVLTYGGGSGTIIPGGACYVTNSIASTKYISVSFTIALEV